VIPSGSGGSLASKPFNDKKLKIIKADVKNQADVDFVFDAADDICTSRKNQEYWSHYAYITDSTSELIQWNEIKGEALRIEC